jgi:hypothetical protein
MPKPELKDLLRSELQARYGHSSYALHALHAHPALFAPLRRPRFPIVLCHGTPGRAARAACAELSARGFCRAVRARRARAGRVPEDAGAQLEERARDLRNTVGAEVFVTSVPPCVSLLRPSLPH